MKHPLIYMAMYVMIIKCAFAQQTAVISGQIMAGKSAISLSEITINSDKFSKLISSDIHGVFQFKFSGEFPVRFAISISGYQTKYFELESFQSKIDLGTIYFELTNNLMEEAMINTAELDDFEDDASNSIAGVLNSNQSVIEKTFAYEFSPAFVRPKGISNDYQTVMINHTSLNSMFNRKVEWGNLGGLNDAIKNRNSFGFQELSMGVSQKFGTSTNISTSNTNFRKGLKVSYASSNRSYKGRVMVTYSDVLDDDWYYTFSSSYRFGKEGFKEGTPYQSYALFLSIDKSLSKRHQLNFTTLWSHQERGKSSPITEEVYQLKAPDYNAYWGWQNGKIRSGRLKKVSQPFFQFNHNFKNSKWHWHSHVSYQFGENAQSRIDYGGTQLVHYEDDASAFIGRGVNPDPTYYQMLPSYFLRDQDNPDYEGAYLAEKEFLTNGQIKWQELYDANLNSNQEKKPAIYANYKDRQEDYNLWLNSNATVIFNEHLEASLRVAYRNYKSNHFAEMMDLLGADYFLDIDLYADDFTLAQNDLKRPNRQVVEGEKYKYNYSVLGQQAGLDSKIRYTTKHLELEFGIGVENTSSQREGHFENGAYPGDQSLGKSKKIDFLTYGLKGVARYKLSGRHMFNAYFSLTKTPPSVTNSFPNIRESNSVIQNLKSENQTTLGLSYFWRHPKIETQIEVYGLSLKNKSNVSFYFADGLTGLNQGENTAYVQEVLTGIGQQHIGLEWFAKYRITESLSIKAVAAIGQAVYKNNPELYITSDAITDKIDYGSVSLKNYKVPNGAQQAFSLGFEYSSPDYWWLGITGNYFTNSYLNIAPITRTKNFYLDDDGQPFPDYDEVIARQLLKQEKLDSFYLVNLVGGKSWKKNQYYFGFFASIQNILNKNYKTGGFEQSRNANYQTLKEDKSRALPLFGPKYWFGYGSTYYLSIYFRI